MATKKLLPPGRRDPAVDLLLSGEQPVAGGRSPTRRYFSARAGRHPGVLPFDLPMLKRLFLAVFLELRDLGFFQEALGDYCIDLEEIPGTCGPDIEGFFLRRLYKPGLWPIAGKLDGYTEDDLFDVIELLHDLVSAPVNGRYHAMGNPRWRDGSMRDGVFARPSGLFHFHDEADNEAGCGWHYDTFVQPPGQRCFRDEVNQLLRDYQDGWELDDNGELLTLGPAGLHELATTPLPASTDPANVRARVEHAARQFRRRGSSHDERRHAVRDLADVLEYLRPQLKLVLTSNDEADLFNLANNFGIRHHNQRQKTNYDPTWLSWIFHHYLATIHLATRLLEQRGAPTD